MTQAETADMSRSLLALSLFAFAALALANEPANCDAPTAVTAKPGKASASTTESEADAPVGQATMRPARAGGTRPVLPRWQSLLPGMIR